MTQKHFTSHKTVYPAISATSPELTQAGRTILVIGGSKGIGRAIARSFAMAAASRVILVARDPAGLLTAAKQIQTAVPSFQGQILRMSCDIGDPDGIEGLWNDLRTQQIYVDVLVLSTSMCGSEGRMLQEIGWKQIWQVFEINIRANMVFVDKFLKQSGDGAPGSRGKKAIINVSSSITHQGHEALGYGGYASTRTSMNSVLQHLAAEIPPEQVQIISFHPGAIYTETLRDLHKYGPDDYDFDSDELPGNFAVWAASPKARFLHGRFMWASWDVDEVARSMSDVFERDDGYWKLGVKGL